MATTKVAEAAVVVRHDRHTRQSLYVLPDAAHWMPRPGAATRVTGPALVLVQEIGTATKVYVYKSLRDKRPWEWLAKLARAGAWALSSKKAAPYLPEELVRQSPRFSGTTRDQRRRMADRTK